MKYVLSGLVGFLMTLALSIPLQQVIRTREAQAVSMRARSQHLAPSSETQSSDYHVKVPPMAPSIHDAREPKVKFLPQYPPEAAAQKIEGYVTLSFQIGDNGSVEDLRVLESQPPAVFDGAARRAVSRWIFGPQEPGSAEEKRLRLVFNLKKSTGEIQIP